MTVLTRVDFLCQSCGVKFKGLPYHDQLRIAGCDNFCFCYIDGFEEEVVKYNKQFSVNRNILLQCDWNKKLQYYGTIPNF